MRSSSCPLRASTLLTELRQQCSSGQSRARCGRSTPFSGATPLARGWLDVLSQVGEMPKGVAFVLVDYPGYGDSRGTPTTLSIKRTSELALREAYHATDIFVHLCITLYVPVYLCIFVHSTMFYRSSFLKHPTSEARSTHTHQRCPCCSLPAPRTWILVNGTFVSNLV